MRFASATALGLALLCAQAPAGAGEGRGRVLLVGVDAMTFDLLDPLIAQGRLPTLAGLVEGGARAVLRSEKPMRSPALWTTIATGQPRKVHGIFDFVTGSAYWPEAQRGDERRLVTSGMRRARALWQLAGDAGKRSLVVGWLNSWPAEPLSGIMVAPYVALGTLKQTTIKGRIYEDVSHQTFPPQLFASLRPLVVSTDHVPPDLLSRIVSVPDPRSRLYTEVPQLKRYLYTARWSIASTLTNVGIIEKLLREHPDIELVMTYFDGADTLGHRFWVMREPLPRVRARLEAHGMDPDLAPELKRRLGHAVEGYYELVDAVLARMLAAAGSGATVVIVSDHGFGACQSARAPYDHVPFDGEHRMGGVLIANGPHVRPGRYAARTQYDIVPTVLALMSTAAPEGLPGSAAAEMLDLEALGEPMVPAMAQRERRARPGQRPAAAEEAGFSAQELERLRSLGYVQ